MQRGRKTRVEQRLAEFAGKSKAFRRFCKSFSMNARSRSTSRLIWGETFAF
jgi:hypothetical protein